MASVSTMAEGNPVNSRSFTSANMMLPPDPSISTESRSKRPGLASTASTIGLPIESPTMVSIVARSFSMVWRTVPASMAGVGWSTDRPPLRMAPQADQCPLT